MLNERQAPQGGTNSKDRKQFGIDLDAKSNLELLDELDEYIQTVGEFELDGQMVHTYLAKLQERAPIEAGDQEAVRQGLPLGRRGDSTSPDRRHRVFRLILTGFAAVFALVVIAGALGYRPINDAWEWLKEVVYIRVNPSGEMSLPDGVVGEYASLQDALSQNSIEISVPSWIPTDCAYIDTSLRIDDKGRVRAVAFYGSNQREFRIQCTSTNEIDIAGFDEKATEEYTFSCHGKEYMIIRNNKNSKATWNIGPYTCMISGSLSGEELEHMIRSIQ